MVVGHPVTRMPASPRRTELDDTFLSVGCALGSGRSWKGKESRKFWNKAECIRKAGKNVSVFSGATGVSVLGHLTSCLTGGLDPPCQSV